MQASLRISCPALAIAAAFAVVPVTALADDAMFMNPGDVKWGPAPPSLPKGAKAAVLYGKEDVRIERASSKPVSMRFI